MLNIFDDLKNSVLDKLGGEAGGGIVDEIKNGVMDKLTGGEAAGEGGSVLGDIASSFLGGNNDAASEGGIVDNIKNAVADQLGGGEAGGGIVDGIMGKIGEWLGGGKNAAVAAMVALGVAAGASSLHAAGLGAANEPLEVKSVQNGVIRINDMDYIAIGGACDEWRAGDMVRYAGGGRGARCLEVELINSRSAKSCRLMCDAR